MNSICLIGNSHIAGFSKLLSKYDSVGIDMFAAGGKRMLTIGQTNGVLHLRKPEQFHSNTNNKNIEINRYQHLIVYGCQVISRGSGTFWLNNYYDTVSLRYSGACISSLHLSALKSSISYKTINLIRASGYQGKVTIIPSPLPNELHPEIKGGFGEEKPFILRSIGNLYTQALAEKKVNFHMLPEELLSENNYTTSKLFLNKSSVINSDFSHLNIDGSKLVLSSIIDYLHSYKPAPI